MLERIQDWLHRAGLAFLGMRACPDCGGRGEDAFTGCFLCDTTGAVARR